MNQIACLRQISTALLSPTHPDEQQSPRIFHVRNEEISCPHAALSYYHRSSAYIPSLPLVPPDTEPADHIHSVSSRYSDLMNVEKRLSTISISSIPLYTYCPSRWLDSESRKPPARPCLQSVLQVPGIPQAAYQERISIRILIQSLSHTGNIHTSLHIRFIVFKHTCNFIHG